MQRSGYCALNYAYVQYSDLPLFPVVPLFRPLPSLPMFLEEKEDNGPNISYAFHTFRILKSILIFGCLHSTLLLRSRVIYQGAQFNFLASS